MAATASILISLHGKRVGLDSKGRLVVAGRLVPSMDDTGALKVVQPAPGTQDATGTLTAAQLLGGIITSSTAAAVSGTLPTGTLLDAAAGLEIGEAIEWVVINTGATNAFTIIAATGHTIVGSAIVALSSSGRFRSRKTAANTIVTYRV
jgi:hypothetical protein